MTDAEPLQELRVLVSALHAHAAWQELTGATFLPAATAETSSERGALELPAPVQRRGPPPKATQVARAPNPTPVEARPPRVFDAGPPRTTTSGAVIAREPLPEVSPARPAPASGTRHDAMPGAPRVTEAEPRVPRPLDGHGPSEAAVKRLAVLATEVAGCTRCGLAAGRTQTVFARGTGTSGICFIGEGPGADEDAQGEPFVGAAGQLLDKMIAAMGLGRDEVYVCNIVKCRPPENRKPEPEEMQACTPFLTEQLDLLAPQVIVALGGTAVQGLLGTTGGITRLRGTWRFYRGIAVMPTFHPAFLLRQPSSKKLVWQDLQEVLRHVGRAQPAAK